MHVHESVASVLSATWRVAQCSRERKGERPPPDRPRFVEEGRCGCSAVTDAAPGPSLLLPCGAAGPLPSRRSLRVTGAAVLFQGQPGSPSAVDGTAERPIRGRLESPLGYARVTARSTSVVARGDGYVMVSGCVGGHLGFRTELRTQGGQSGLRTEPDSPTGQSWLRLGTHQTTAVN